MSEDGVGEDGSGRTKVIAIAIVLILTIACVSAYILFNPKDDSGHYSDSIYLYWDTEHTESAWLVKIVNVIKGNESQRNISSSELYLDVFDNETWTSLEGIRFSEISNESSPLGVKWVDVNSNGLVEIGDYLSINKSGGSGGIIDLNTYELSLIAVTDRIEFNPSPIIYLPPVEFMDMGVVKTPTGWNMTVTWVNEMIPNEFMMWSYLPDQIENLTGNVITVIVGPINHPYQQIWHDHDNNTFISEGDVIEIINSDGKIESGYIYRLMNNKYGYRHTIMEVVLI